MPPDSVYLDNSATTPIADEVLAAMEPYYAVEYGNPSSLHRFGRRARTAIEDARAAIAETIGAAPSEIVFTSGATEADNLAIKGLAFARPDKRHLVTSKIEHHAVLHACQWLEERGYEVSYLDVDQDGKVDPDAVKDAIRDDTLLVSVMAGNNEIGTIEPIGKIGAICKERGVPFHTDAVQAYGPKGVGFLYVQKGIRLSPLLSGGGHERGLRSGTENVPGIVGLAAAARLAFAERDTVVPRLRAFREKLIDRVMQIPRGAGYGRPPPLGVPGEADRSGDADSGCEAERSSDGEPPPYRELQLRRDRGGEPGDEARSARHRPARPAPPRTSSRVTSLSQSAYRSPWRTGASASAPAARRRRMRSTGSSASFPRWSRSSARCRRSRWMSDVYRKGDRALPQSEEHGEARWLLSGRQGGKHRLRRCDVALHQGRPRRPPRAKPSPRRSRSRIRMWRASSAGSLR